MRNSGTLPSGQIYFKQEKRHGMRTLPARAPSKKQRRRWRRMLRRKHMTAEEYRIALARRRRLTIYNSGQGW